MPSNAVPESAGRSHAVVAELPTGCSRRAFTARSGSCWDARRARLMRSWHLHWSWAAGALALVVLVRPLFGWPHVDVGASGAAGQRPRSALAPRRRRSRRGSGGACGSTEAVRWISCACSWQRRGRAFARVAAASDGSMGNDWCWGSTRAVVRCRSRSAQTERGRTRLWWAPPAPVRRSRRRWIAARAIDQRDGRDRGRSQGRRRDARAAAPRRTGGGKAISRMDARWSQRLQPVRTGRCERDRRQGSGRRALHRAALPAPGTALSRSRRRDAARGRRAGQPRRDRRSTSSLRGWRRSPARCPRPRLARPSPTWIRSPLDSSSELAGVRDRLGDPGRVRRRALAGSAVRPVSSEFDLLSAVRRRAVVYFSLESDSRPLLSAMLGAAIVQDLQTTAGVSAASACADTGGDRRVLGRSPPSRSCGCSAGPARPGSVCCWVRRSSPICARPAASGCSSRCWETCLY